MRYLMIFSIILTLLGCTSKVAVMTLESTITQAALSAKRATNGASDTLNIEVSVTTGYKAGAAVPIPVPVVPIDVSATSSTTTKLKLEVDLRDFKPPADIKSNAQQVFILDTNTGLLLPSGS
jgi:hypothetical protein